MQQEPITKPPTVEQYIRRGLRKIEYVVLRLQRVEVAPKEFDIYARAKKFLVLASEGKITETYERDLARRYRVRASEDDFTREGIKKRISLNGRLDQLLDLASYYSVMAFIFYKGENQEQVTYYLIKAAEIQGLIQGLIPEFKTAK